MNFEKAVVEMDNSGKIYADHERGVKKVQVYGTGTISTLPDLCKVVLRISSQKNDTASAKNSVNKRFDYVIQSIQNFKFSSSEVRVSKTLTRESEQFCYTVLITLITSKVDVIEELCNFLVEKLENMVEFKPMHLFHSNENLEKSRRSAALLALNNARQKAQEMAQQVGYIIGDPLLLREEPDIQGNPEVASGDEHSSPKHNSTSWRSDPEASRVQVRATVMAVFEMKRKKDR